MLPVHRQPSLAVGAAHAGLVVPLSAQQQYTPAHDQCLHYSRAQACMGLSNGSDSSGNGAYSVHPSSDERIRPRSQYQQGSVNFTGLRNKAEASRLVPVEPPLQSNASTSARDPSPMFRNTKVQRFWIPDPPCGRSQDWLDWVESHASDSMPPSVVTKALRALTRPSTGSDTTEPSTDAVLHAVHSLLKLSVSHAHANPEMVLEQVARSDFLRQHLPTHPACYNAVLTLFTRACTSPRTFSDPLSVSQLAVSQVRLQCEAPLFWAQLSRAHAAQIDNYPVQQIVNLVWAAAKLGVNVPEQLMHQLHHAVLRVLPDCNHWNIATLAWGFAKNSTLRQAMDTSTDGVSPEDDPFSTTGVSSGEFASMGGQAASSRGVARPGPAQEPLDSFEDALGGADRWLADPARALSAHAVPASWDSSPDAEFGSATALAQGRGSKMDSEGGQEAGAAWFSSLHAAWISVVVLLMDRLATRSP